MLYKLTLINEKKEINQTFSIDDKTPILNAAIEEDITLPFLCQSGDCFSCACKLISGSIKHTAQTGLSQDDLNEGYLLACSAYVTSDSIIETHKEKDLARFRKGI